ncbi:MerR family transcriptional regulator [Nocardioides sp. LML1-1-1.1]|uniref:MerR family transcriptional regulator n=1 Tax=Nocardioides sp. LML1-1-1.1 TaxID=3135248 RepID=UPI00342F3D5B
MTTSTARRSYTIKEVAALTGLPASTLRYYESIGVISPISRGASSKHRVYDEDDLDQLMWVACLAATGLSVADMRTYVANGRCGPEAAADQVTLLTAQQARLRAEAEHLALRQRYVALKIDYWRAVEAGATDRAQEISVEADRLADELRRGRTD